MAIFTPIAWMLTAPITVGLNIVVPVVRVRCPAGFLPATLACPLAFSARAELLPRGLSSGVKEFVAGCTTPLFHTSLCASEINAESLGWEAYGSK
jgi:hypothetical protein